MKFLAFGRSETDDKWMSPEDAYWWPLYIQDGPHEADSPEAALALIRERLELGGEDRWREVAVVEADTWTVSNTESERP